MPEKIGKYRVMDRIGRGGMGMIFKAHDPILDRLVALKVISPEVEVTDELRARFFREAQACAKLNHPNIVTVFDMGEDQGRLFIVMELLEGDELRRLITPRTPLALEDKLSVMLQVCSGLHYAHQKGIVHRDMKPGNIFLLRNGQAKILDFGIAHIVTTEAGLTRTGLIMGTLRYISPEQVRGRVDHRSDMFSIGSVFYELLTLRPPFLGDDPMQLLEQLRTEDPPPPTEIDPTIPPELAAIVQRAMRKNPAERFHDLEEMRSELEVVHGGLIEKRQHVLARVRRQRDRIVQLQAALAERVGVPGEEESIPTIVERSGLVAAQAAERDVAGIMSAMEAKIAQAEALAPAFQRANELLDAGRFADAAEQFETIVADMPDHRRAHEGLARARAGADAHRQRELTADLLQKARTALDDRRYALCLEILKQAAANPLPAGTTEAMTALRQAAEAGLGDQETRRLARQEADKAHEQMAKERGDAQAEDAAQLAPSLWNEAEALAAAAQASLRRDAYAEAEQGFDQAAAVYRRSLEAARQMQVEGRQTAERGREMAAQGQNQARAAGAPQYARELWDAAEARFAEAQAAFAKQASGRAHTAFTEAAALYRRADDAARDARERDHRRAEAARERAAEGRRSAATMDAEHRAPAAWTEAVGKSAQGEAALLRKQYAQAAEAFQAALTLYHQAQAQVRDLARRQREEARKKQQEMAERRRGALAADAAAQAPSDWNEAEASAAAGEAAMAGDAWDDAGRAFDQAASLYRLAENRAREALRTRVDADKAVEATGLARRAAAAAHAATYAPDAWRDAESAEARAVAALSQQQFAVARPLFAEAGRLYAASARAAGSAAEADPKLKPRQPAAETLRAQAQETLRQAEEATRQVEAAVKSTVGVDAPKGFDDAATVMIRPTEMVEQRGEDATVLASPTKSGGAVRLPSVKSGVGEVEPPRVGRNIAEETPGRFRRLRARAAVVVGVGALAAVVLVVLFWRSQPPPVSPPAATQVPPSQLPPTQLPPAQPTAATPVARSSESPAGRDAAEQLRSQANPSSVQSPDRVVATTPAPPKPSPIGGGRIASTKPPAASKPAAAPQPEPSRIRESVEQKLRAARLLRNPNSDEPGVAVEDVGADGNVRLVGVLRDAAARQAAADLARTVAGVTTVDVRRVTVQKGWVTQ